MLNETTHHAGIRFFSDMSYSFECGVYLYVGAKCIGASVKDFNLKFEFVLISLRS